MLQIRKKGSILCVIFKKKIKFLTSHSKNKGFNSLRHIQRKKGSILCIIFEKSRHVKNPRKNFNSLSHIQEKGPILSVLVKKSSILWVKLNNIKSLSPIEKGSILWVILKKSGFDSSGHVKKINFDFFDYFSTKNFNLSHIQKNGFDSLSRIQKKKSSIFWVILRKRFNSLNHTQKRGSILWVIFKKKKVQPFWVKFKKKRFDSLSRIKKKKVQFFDFFFLKKKNLGLVLKKKVKFFESCKNSSYEREVLFFETYQRKKVIPLSRIGDFNSLSRIQKKSSMSKKKGHIQKKNQFCESYWKKCSVSRIRTSKKNIWRVIVQKKGSILWVFFWKKYSKKEGSSLWVIKKSNSLIFWQKKSKVFESW